MMIGIPSTRIRGLAYRRHPSQAKFRVAETKSFTRILVAQQQLSRFEALERRLAALEENLAGPTSQAPRGRVA
jgi:hypothetical protein